MFIILVIINYLIPVSHINLAQIGLQSSEEARKQENKIFSAVDNFLVRRFTTPLLVKQVCHPTILKFKVFKTPALRKDF